MAASSSDFVFYHYKPSVPAAAVFLAVFLITTVLHCYQLARTRTWYLVPLVVGGFFEWIGYVGRLLSSIESPNYALAPYIIQSLLLLVAPALFAASVYMELKYIILLVNGEELSPIRKTLLTKVFVLGDVISFMIQSAGAGILPENKPGAKKAGTYIIIGGLCFQLLFFGIFMLVSITFHRRILKAPTKRSLSVEVPWRKHLVALYTASMLILLRSVFRVVEFVQGDNGYLLRNEIWFYIFDATLMFSMMFLFNVIHPSEVNGLLTGRKASKGVVKLEQMQKLSEADDFPIEAGADCGEISHC